MNKLRIFLIGLLILASVPSFSQDENKFVAGVDFTLRGISRVSLSGYGTVNFTASYKKHQLFAGIMSYYIENTDVIGFDGGYRFHFYKLGENWKLFAESAVSYMRGANGYADFKNYNNWGNGLSQEPFRNRCLALSEALGIKYNLFDKGYFLIALGYGFAKIEEDHFGDSKTNIYYHSGIFIRLGFGINIYSNKK